MNNHAYTLPERDQVSMSHEARLIEANTETQREPLWGNQGAQSDGSFYNQGPERMDLEESKVRLTDEKDKKNNESKPNEFEPLQKQLNKVLEGWTIVKKMGKGGSGAVYRIQDSDGSIRVIKLFEKKSEKDYQRETSIMKLLEDSPEEMLRYPSNDNKLTLDDYFMIVQEAGLATLKQFKKFLKHGNKTLNETQLMSIFCALYSSLVSLRDQNICHRDIKPDNIILRYKKSSNTINLKLIDYNIARIYGDFTELSGLSGTSGYIDPEIRNRSPQKYTKNELIWADLFSIGIVTLELAFPDFKPVQNDTQTINDLLSKLSDMPDMESPSKILNTIFSDQKKDLTELENLIVNSRTEDKYLFDPSSPLELKGYIEEFKEYIQDKEDYLEDKYHRLHKEELIDIDYCLEKAESLEDNEEIINRYHNIMYDNHKKASPFCEKMLDNLELIEDPLIFSALGVYLCLEKRFDDALTIFTLGLEKATNAEDKRAQVVIYNNVGCLFFYSNAEDPRMMENFDKAYEILIDNICKFRSSIMQRWLSTSCSNLGEINRAPIIDYSSENQLHYFTVLLSIKHMNPTHTYSESDEKVEFELSAIILFNISHVKASIYERRLEQEQQNHVLESIHQLCFYFNHTHTKSVHQIFGLPGELDFFYYLLKFVIIVLAKDRNIDDDPIYLDADDFYGGREPIFDDFSSSSAYTFPTILKMQFFQVFIGFPLLFSSPTSNKKWCRRELLLNQISVLRHASKLIQIEKRDLSESIQTEEHKKIQESRFSNYCIETQNPSDPILDLVPPQSSKDFTFKISGVKIWPMIYRMIWDDSKNVDQQNWSIYSAKIHMNQPFRYDGDEDSEILEDCLRKLQTVKDLRWTFAQEGSIAKKLDLSIFSAFHTLQLTHLHLVFYCMGGLISYPIRTIAKYIESQVNLTSLELTNFKIIFEDEDLKPLGLILNKLIALKDFKLIFQLCPNVTYPMIKSIIDGADHMPSLESLSIFFFSCERLFENTKDELKKLIQDRSEVFPSLKNIIVEN